MKKLKYFMILVVVISSFVLSACAAKATEEPNGDKPVPAPYTGMKKPFDGNADALTAGKKVYTDNCATCHGDTGKGDGPGGASLNPKPADLSDAATNDEDDRLYWTVAEGGDAAGKSKDMKPWKDILSKDEIWQVLTFVRTFKTK